SNEVVGRMRTFLDRYVGLFEMTESRRLGNLIDDRFYGLDRPYLDRLREGFRTVDSAAIRRVVRQHLGAENLHVAIVHKDARMLAEALAADAPSSITYREEKPPAILEEDREIQAYPLRISRDAIRIVPVTEVFAR
ncbi:MAG: insulinase family protein, partial [Actinobacteria bacterium]|nr:insulinase family protein [Actinomycetota bacterium]